MRDLENPYEMPNPEPIYPGRLILAQGKPNDTFREDSVERAQLKYDNQPPIKTKKHKRKSKSPKKTPNKDVPEDQKPINIEVKAE